MSYPTDFVRLAALTPRVRVGDVAFNTAETIAAARLAATNEAQLAVFPELGLTGYTLGDLVQQPVLLEAAITSLVELARSTNDLPIALVVGLPLEVDGKLYNMAAVLAGGKICGLVPKQYLPNYQEFYDVRWFTPGDQLTATEVLIGEQSVPVGIDLLFDLLGFTLGVEICEDLWAPIPPSSFLTLAGATVIANVSASNELASKAEYRRNLVVQQSARTRAAYVYAAAGVGESTTDLVFGGHNLIAANGQLVAQSAVAEREPVPTVADVDLSHLLIDRRRANTFALPPQLAAPTYRRIGCEVKQTQPQRLIALPNRSPFVPADGPERAARSAEIFTLQSAALASRLEQAGIKDLVLGLSGGLDSTLALLVGLRALRDLGRPLSHMHAITLPGMATSDRTKSNAHQLGRLLKFEVEEIAIGEGSARQLAELGHNGADQDVTYQNTQARYRTALLLGRANQLRGLVLGTGDLSEIALGWSTFNGDHISHYHVNAGVPKTLVRHLVAWAAEQPEFVVAEAVLQDILDTPISPELAADENGKELQNTEDLIGPYDLNDFYLYHFVRWGTEPKKLLELAGAAFGDTYTSDELIHWLKQFLTRFFGAQWKRSVMPDGPKVGSVSLSPRGDWRMPSSMSAKTWLDTLQ